MLVKIKSYEEIEKTLNFRNEDNTCLGFHYMMKNLCGKTINVSLTQNIHNTKNKNWYITISRIVKGMNGGSGWTFSSNWFDVIPEQLELEF